VLSGKVGRSEAAVINQIINTRARLIELERKIREQEELNERLEALEETLGSTKGGHLYGA
jgi:predicted DNA-binding protein